MELVKYIMICDGVIWSAAVAGPVLAPNPEAWMACDMSWCNSARRWLGSHDRVSTIDQVCCYTNPWYKFGNDVEQFHSNLRAMLQVLDFKTLLPVCRLFVHPGISRQNPAQVYGGYQLNIQHWLNTSLAICAQYPTLIIIRTKCYCSCFPGY